MRSLWLLASLLVLAEVGSANEEAQMPNRINMAARYECGPKAEMTLEIAALTVNYARDDVRPGETEGTKITRILIDGVEAIKPIHDGLQAVADKFRTDVKFDVGCSSGMSSDDFWFVMISGYPRVYDKDGCPRESYTSVFRKGEFRGTLKGSDCHW